MKTNKKCFKFNLLLIMLFITAILITVSMTIFKQPIIRVLPLYVSLVIYFLASKINRYSLLIGAINSIFYAGIFFYYKLYGLAAQAILISSTMQIIAFVRWNKRPYGNSTVLKKMNKKQKTLTLISIAVSLCVLCPLLSMTDTPQALLDSAVTIISTYSSVLCMLYYVEYTKFSLVSSVLTLWLYIAMIMQGNHEQVAYLIFTVFGLICVTKSVFTAKKLLIEQSKKGEV